jgi:hypothetical protein
MYPNSSAPHLNNRTCSGGIPHDFTITCKKETLFECFTCDFPAVSDSIINRFIGHFNIGCVQNWHPRVYV